MRNWNQQMRNWNRRKIVKKVVKFGGSSLASAGQFEWGILSGRMRAGVMWCLLHRESGIPKT